jgi:hypothetical protein
MAIILKANNVIVVVCSVVCVFGYHSPNVLGTPHICKISRLRVNQRLNHVKIKFSDQAVADRPKAVVLISLGLCRC